MASSNKLNNFLNEKLAEIKNTYIASTDNIERDYKIEQDNIKSYDGRQLFELLQNADDASAIAIEKSVL